MELDQTTLFGMADEHNRLTTNSYKTAIGRKGPSSVAKAIVKGVVSGIFPRFDTVLDWGCGRGRDVLFYQERGLDVDGYDVYAGFGRSKFPTRKYDLVTVIFVVNILPSLGERLGVLRKAASFVQPGGYLVVTARSPQTIAREVSAKKWPKYNDGYISHQGRGTFQKGIDAKELASMIVHLGFALPVQAETQGTGA